MYLSVAVTKTTTSHPFLHTNSSSSTPSSVTKVCLLLLSTDSTNGLPPPPTKWSDTNGPKVGPKKFQKKMSKKWSNSPVNILPYAMPTSPIVKIDNQWILISTDIDRNRCTEVKKKLLIPSSMIDIHWLAPIRCFPIWPQVLITAVLGQFTPILTD